MGAVDRMHRAPISNPPFTLGEIKKAIPSHCFRRSILRSSYYLVHDLVIASFFFYIANNYFVNLSNYPIKYLVAWPLYWICQGCILMGTVWLIGHECGHHSFSDYQWLDDSLGLIIHSALLTPYFSWRISHRHHHSNTNSLDRDQVHIPKTKHGRGPLAMYVDDSPILKIFLRVTIGWPLYLWFNLSGRKYDRFANHFDPQSPIISESERAQVFISNLGLLASDLFGLLICMYGVPLSIVNALLVTITYLQHTHASIPHYDDDASEWDWLRGSLTTVDRDYGILNYVFHNVTNTHVVHHLFTTMPHYHAVEATKAVKPILGNYYQFDGTPILKAVWREAKECVYVEKDEDENNKGVFWYTNKP
ncbi:hypothetical protein ACJIZ3_024952 [Penstemon smallii]|uniref:Uncharacterized protein n=1 Tax=Penstemon smallii TaxID=265156 RepID=A0ABD3TUZ6_9LAMI